MIDSFIQEMVIDYMTDTRQNTGNIAMNEAEMLSALFLQFIWQEGDKLLGSYYTVQYSMMMNVQIAMEPNLTGRTLSRLGCVQKKFGSQTSLRMY